MRKEVMVWGFEKCILVDGGEGFLRVWIEDVMDADGPKDAA